MNDLKVDWNNWGLGSRIIFASSCVAIVSMLFNWVNVGFIAENGFSQQTVIFLGLWVDPALFLLQGKKIDKNIGLGCAAGSFLVTAFYINSKTVVLLGNSVNAAGLGAWIFLLASAALGYGVFQFDKEYQVQDTPPKD